MMTFGDKLSQKRKEYHYTQEQLAEILGVSRQAISKWESGLTYPETDKMIRMCELFHCSLDYMVRDTEETGGESQKAKTETPFFKKYLCERKSQKMVRGVPLWHIGRHARGIIAIGLQAHGVIAIGLKATGILSFGMLAIGLLPFGLLSIGLIALGLFAIGILAGGCFAAGILAAGAVSFGIIALGAVAIGDFSVGALAIGKYFALGDNAKAMIALGDTKTAGSLLQRVGDLSPQDIAAAKQALDAAVPAYLSWAKELIKLFL